MLKSKFKFRALLIPLLIIALGFTSLYILIENWPLKIEKIRWIDFYVAFLIVFSLVWLVFGELRTKIIEVIIENGHIEKRNYIGLRKKYNFKDFDGYQTSILISKGEAFEYLYLIKDNQKIIKLSEAYHKNYLELKSRISTSLKNFGEIKFNYIDELKEIFK